MNELPSDPSADDEETTEIWSQHHSLRLQLRLLFRRSDSSELNRRVTVKVFEEARVSHLPTVPSTKTSGEEELNNLNILFHHVLFWLGGRGVEGGLPGD